MSTRETATRALVRLYATAYEVNGTSLDITMTSLDFPKIRMCLNSHLQKLNNDATRRKLNLTKHWAWCITFLEYVLEYLGKLEDDRWLDIRSQIRLLQTAYGNFSLDGRDKQPAPLRSLPSTVVSDLYEIFDPGSARNPFRSKRTRSRNYLIFLTLLQTGIRRSEMLLLYVDSVNAEFDDSAGRLISWMVLSDLDEDEKPKRLNDPRSPPPNFKNPIARRNLPISEELLAVYDEYLEARPASNWPFLFLSQRGRPLSMRQVNEIFLMASIALSPDAVRALRVKLEGATRRADAALARLAPWTGDGDALTCLPRVDDSEVHEARDALAALVTEVRREEEAAQRASDQSAAAALEISQLATGTAVSPEDMAEVRTERDRLWRPLREHLLNGAALQAPAEAIAGYESGVAAADDRADARFASADASGKLSLLDQTRASHDLTRRQAETRAQSARNCHEETVAGWKRRLADVGLPALEPGRFHSWQADRDVAEAAQAEVRNLIADVELSEAKRDAARAAMSAALGVADGGGPIAPVLARAERRRAEFEDVARKRLLAQAELDQLDVETAALDRRQRVAEDALDANGDAWRAALTEAGLDIEVSACSAVLDLLDELREATASEASLRRRIESIGRDTREHAAAVGQLADAIGVPAGEVQERLCSLRDRLAAARSAATLNGSLDDEDKRRHGELQEAQAKLKATEEALTPLLAETGSADRVALGAAIERSRAKRGLADEIAATERAILEAGDGLRLDELLAAVGAADPDQVAAQLESLGSRLEELNAAVDEAATAHGDARATFAALDTDGTSAVDAAAHAEQARSELEVLAEDYILKRTQAVTLKWAIEKYRERHQDPLLLRAGELFSTLTTGRYATLKVDTDAPSPRLLGMRDDMRTMVEVDAMSEGTTDQLFLALRLAALEQSVAAGVGLPFLADDLFVNFDDRRAEAGFRVLAEVARTTQVLFFTHHPHLVQIAKSVVGAELHSECALS